MPPAALKPFRNRDFHLAEPADPAQVPGLQAVLEDSAPWTHPAPAFVCNLSGAAIPGWIHPHQRSPARYLCRHEGALVFAQNSTLDRDGTWACESQVFRLQYLRSYDAPSYRHFFPGPRPSLRLAERSAVLSLAGVDDARITHVREPVFLATSLEPDNWGRWVATVVPKAEYALRHCPDRRLFCRALKPWQRASLNTLGIPDERILAHDPGGIYLCDDLATIRYAQTSMILPAGDRAVWQGLAARLRKPGPPEKLFVSRLLVSRAKPNYRRLMNEESLIDAAARRGFRVIQPETMSFADQVATFANAQAVMGLGGAAMYNVAFCPPGTPVVTIESSPRFIRPHSAMFASLGHPYGVVFGRQDEADPSPHHRRWSVDVDASLDAASGFLG